MGSLLASLGRSVIGFSELHSLGRRDVCLRESRLVNGQFGCSGLPPSDANIGKGMALKVNVKIFQLFKFLVKSYETFRL